MIIFAWEDKVLRQICEDAAAAHAELGKELSSKLQARLTEMRIAPSVGDLVVGSPGEVPNVSAPMFKVDIGSTHRLYFMPNHPTLPKLPSGAIDWNKITRIKLLKIQQI